TRGGSSGVALVAWDRGPGMNVEACLRDGMSTAGTAGAGLGAISRLASRWDAYSRRGQGTVVTATVFAHEPVSPARFAVGGVCVPYPGMTRSGDAWAMHVEGDVTSVIVVDGLGHGDGAAEAAAAVIASFRTRPLDAPGDILMRADQAARPTRGAGATVARVDGREQTCVVAGVGNVQPWLIGESQRQLVTQHGTLGQATPKLRDERYPFPAGTTLVIHSDGLKSRWNLGAHPGLLACAPYTIAATLWRDFGRGRDDAIVVVLREGP
ncbi:MAG: SpoIIE family protein phosphatase, partial [Myxococcota bacterium]|nr:SpoIIE family protein phosphatase [Myxococcota bacterium]